MVCTQNQRLHKQLDEPLHRCFQNWASRAQDEWRKLSPATSVSDVQIEIKSVRFQDHPWGGSTCGPQDPEKGRSNGIERSTRLVEFIRAGESQQGRSAWLLQFDTTGLLRCIDVMLGGCGDPSDVPSGVPSGDTGNEANSPADLHWTSIEDRLVDWLVTPWCKRLVDILAPASAVIRTAISKSDGMLQDRFPSSMDYCIVDFEVRIRETAGRTQINSGMWLVPLKSLAPYLEGVFGKEQTVRQQHELVAVMARSTLTEEDIRQMEVGDVIATEVDASGSFSLELYGTPLFSIQPGVVHGKKAIRIVQQ